MNNTDQTIINELQELADNWEQSEHYFESLGNTHRAASCAAKAMHYERLIKDIKKGATK